MDRRLQEQLDNIFPQPDTLDDYARLTIRLNKQLTSTIKFHNNRNNNNGIYNNKIWNNSNNTRNNHRNNVNNNSIIRCTRCHRIGHTAENCRVRQLEDRIGTSNNNNNNSVSTIQKSESNYKCPVFDFTLYNDNKNNSVNLLIDTGSYYSFLDTEFVKRNNIPYNQDDSNQIVKGVEGDISIVGITDPIILVRNDHKEILSFYVIKLNGYEGILGIDWIKIHDPFIDFQKNVLIFKSEYCKEHCLNSRQINVITTEEEPELSINLEDNEESMDKIKEIIPPELTDLIDVFVKKNP